MALALLVFIAAPARAESFGVAQLMEDLARHGSGHARFVEKHYFAVLDAPLVSSGELSFTAPDKLEKRTLEPKPELMQLDGREVVIERGRQHLSFGLDERPELGALIESLRAALSGNRQTLEQNFSLSLAGKRDQWSLTLVPINPRVAAVIARVVLSGAGGQLLGVEYDQADGDRSVMSIEPVGAK